MDDYFIKYQIKSDITKNCGSSSLINFKSHFPESSEYRTIRTEDSSASICISLILVSNASTQTDNFLFKIISKIYWITECSVVLFDP